MDFTLYLCCFLPLIILFITNWRGQQQAIHHIKRTKKKKETMYMLELAKQFIGQDCIIYFLGSSTVSGVIKEISESGNAILIENGKDIDLVNLEFVTRIRKYPLNKKGKRKELILD